MASWYHRSTKTYFWSTNPCSSSGFLHWVIPDSPEIKYHVHDHSLYHKNHASMALWQHNSIKTWFHHRPLWFFALDHPELTIRSHIIFMVSDHTTKITDSQLCGDTLMQNHDVRTWILWVFCAGWSYSSSNYISCLWTELAAQKSWFHSFLATSCYKNMVNNHRSSWILHFLKENYTKSSIKSH